MAKTAANRVARTLSPHWKTKREEGEKEQVKGRDKKDGGPMYSTD